MIAFAPLKIDD